MVTLAGLTSNQVLPVITLLLGFGAGLVADHLNDTRQRKRERTRWIVEQQAATITDLANVLRDDCERMQVVVLQRKQEFTKTRTWPERVDASDTEWAARSRAFVLMQRLQDDDLRAKVDHLTSVTSEAATTVDAYSLEARDTAMDAVMGWQDVNEDLGAALRDLYPAK